MDDLAGQVAVVTGSAAGIGRAIATELARVGSTVVGVDVAPQAELPGDLTPLIGDIEADDPQTLADRIIAVNGPPSLIVNNVGIDLPGTFLTGGAGVLDRSLALNLRGPWLLTRTLVEPLLQRERSASIIFVSSLHSRWTRTHPHYSASKAALAMLVRELAHELGPRGIRVNAVSPGVIATASVAEPASDAERERVRRLVPLQRIGQPEDVARMVAVLLSDRISGYVTGVDVSVDGGLGTFTWSDQL